MTNSYDFVVIGGGSGGYAAARIAYDHGMKAAVIRQEVTEFIHEIVVAMHFRATALEFIKIPHYHPTLSGI